MEIFVMPDPTEIILGAEGLEEIIQNVRIIVGTRVGTVPLDRDFGISWDMIDTPTPAAKAKFTSEIIEKVEKYEPRVKVTEVVWDESENIDGKLSPRIRLEIIES